MEQSSASCQDIDVVIANWNSGNLLGSCIAALAETTIAQRLKVIIVDNASSDGSCDASEHCGLNVDLVRNADNRGFAQACNQGAARGTAAFVLFLNPDTRVAPDSLSRALAYLRSPENASTGVVGARLVDETGHTHRTCARDPSLGRIIGQNAGIDRLFPTWVEPHFMDEWDHEETRPVDQVMGAFLMIRRSLFESLGGFDTRYFVYYEDVDLCRRSRLAGARVVHLADAVAWHLGGGTTDQVKARRLFYLMRSQVLYAGKWFGRGSAFAVLGAALTLNVPIRIALALASLRPRGAAETIEGGWMLLRSVPALLKTLRGGHSNPGNLAAPMKPKP